MRCKTFTKSMAIVFLMAAMTMSCSGNFLCDNQIKNTKTENSIIKTNVYESRMNDLQTITSTVLESKTDKQIEEEYEAIREEEAEVEKKNLYDDFTAEEIYLMQRTIETETHGADFMSRCHVASVIFNRLEHEDFGNSITAIITKPSQFAYWRTTITEETKLALEYAYSYGDTAQGAIAFHSNKKSNTFCGYDYIFTDEAGHHFYK